MPTPTTSPTVRGATCLALTAVLLTLAGCGLPGSSTPVTRSSVVRPSELAESDGHPCPKQLPTGEDPSDHGLGTEEAADELPRLREPDAAWVCRYDSFDVRRTAAGGVVLGWRRAGQPEPVAATDLAGVRDTLEGLTLPDPDVACTDDLGPRWMVVSSHDGDLTGVVVDDYGCRDVRLTDDPHATPPGAEDQAGTVAGVLAGGTEILDAVGVGRSR